MKMPLEDKVNDDKPPPSQPPGLTRVHFVFDNDF